MNPRILSLVFASMFTWLHAEIEPVELRCEYRDNPLGIDAEIPRLQWKLTADKEKRGIRQTAYQIQVATSEPLLKSGKADLWDSGKVLSDQSIQVEYAGKPLTTAMRCHWQVRVWDQSNKPSAWSKPGLWTMGLLKPDDWTAQWIGYDQALQITPEEAKDDRILNIGGLQWLQIPGSHGKPSVTTGFRKQIELPSDRTVRRAVWVLHAFHRCDAFVNGTPAGMAAHWEQTSRLDVTRSLRSGTNQLALSVEQTDPHLPSVIGRLVVQFETGDDLIVPVDMTWKASQELPEGWVKAGFDDVKWPLAVNSGGQPWQGPPPVADLKRVPAPYLRRDFQLDQSVKQATLYVTALGFHDMRLNGKRVSGDVFAPGWQDFNKRVHYQTYDVTSHLKKGSNTIGTILGDGWYASNLAHLAKRNVYGGNPRLLAQLQIEFADGTTKTVASDGHWKAAYGPLRHADIQLGCEYDARLEMPGWDKPGFDDSAWAPVTKTTTQAGRVDVTVVVSAAVKDGKLSMKATNDVFGGDPAQGSLKVLVVDYLLNGKNETVTVAENQQLELVGSDLTITRAIYGKAETGSKYGIIVQAAMLEPSRVIDELPATKLTEPRPGKWTFDMGQNMVGWVRIKVRGERGQRITVRHGEMINADGTIYTAALRSCPATDYYILKGGGEEILEPSFTFHGFQHVEISGLKNTPKLTDVTGIVVHSPMRRTGSFESSHVLLNKLYSNIIWGQKGNFVEVPTDCPQRDERMGWTGDTQFFAPTAVYNFDVAAFYNRWLESCEDGQMADGTVPNVIPDIMGGGGATGWGDAIILVTHVVYQAYADTRIVKDRFDAMERYMKWLESKTKDGITSVGGFGDWLNAGSSAPAPVIDTAYHAHLARIMSEMAKAIGRDEDAARYAIQHEKVKAAFIKSFVQADGSLKGCGQTGYALAFTMDLIPEDLRAKVGEQFVESIKRHNWHLGTGFIGTPRLLPGLAKAGYDDVAYRLLLTDTYPSWLFPVKNGATTMWERWNGWTPDKGFGDVKMNSFNHYAFGAVGEYIYGGVGGIQSTSPAYKTITIQPAIAEGLTWAKTSFDSIHGIISNQWKIDAGKLTMEVVIPPNTTATIHVPAKNANGVSESGSPASKAKGLKFLRTEKGAAVYQVGSGRYLFTSPDLPEGPKPPKLEIIKASYGEISGGAVLDVTEKVRELVRDGALAIEVSNAHFSDPAPGRPKQLEVEYRVNKGNVTSGRAKETERVMLVEPGK